jgi:hypothetical protein
LENGSEVLKDSQAAPFAPALYCAPVEAGANGRGYPVEILSIVKSAGAFNPE